MPRYMVKLGMEGSNQVWIVGGWLAWCRDKINAKPKNVLL
jgi:hypothetical protein